MKTNHLEACSEICQAENVVSRRNSIILIRIHVSVLHVQLQTNSGAITQLYMRIYERKGWCSMAGKGRRLMIYVHNLIWELSSVEITCELTGSGESDSIHRDEREQPEVNTRM